jgi:TolA-binding protein
MHRASLLGIATLLTLVLAAPARAQVTPEQAADMMLNSARKGYNEKNHAFAAARFREFLAKFASHKEAPAARYGLALALIEGPDRNYTEARDLLQTVTQDKAFAELPLAQYYLAVAHRGLGVKELAEADTRPAPEAVAKRSSAVKRFEAALPVFAAALTSLEAKAKAPAKDARELSEEFEWAARARCDVAEMQVRLGKTKEALATALPFVADANHLRSRYKNLGRYFHGYANLLAKDPVGAQKSLTLLAPFNDPAFGTHARYLLARAHHLLDERTEAAAHYEATIADHQKQKLEATNLFKQVDRFKNEPEERDRLVALIRGPAPDHVLRAGFYLALLQYEAGRFGEALSRLQEFLKAKPQPPLQLAAELRIGYCQVQLKQFADALKTLAPLVDRDPLLADQVMFWIAKAQAGAAPDPAANLAGYQQALQVAIQTLRQAATRAQASAAQDPEAMRRRAEVLLELADQLQNARQYKEAVPLYSELANDKLLADRHEEIGPRLCTALHLLGDYAASDKACESFQQKYPQSTLLPAVLFTYAENSYFRIPAAQKIAAPPERTKELARLYAETSKRLEHLIAKYPEFTRIPVARYTLGLTYYHAGELDKVQKVLAEIPPADRTGDLVLVPYLLADCALRQTPTATPEDALAAGQLEEKLKQAITLLEAFIAAQPKHPQTADALLKFGLVQQRLAGLMAQPAEKAKALATARATYERLTKEFPKDAAVPQAIMERAKCIALQGDVNTAMNELRQFANDPLRTSRVAPMALIQLATFLRSQNKAEEAAGILGKAREQHEGNLAKDAEYSSWIGLLRYHHGVALREAGKLPEARGVLELVGKANPGRPEAVEAALRIGQCLRAEGLQRLDAARKLRSSGKKEDVAKAAPVSDDGLKSLRGAAGFLEAQVEQFKKSETLPDIRARMLYEAAWAHRSLAEPEVDVARAVLAKERQQKLGPAAAKFAPPEVPLAQVPWQPSEKRAVALYQALVDTFGEQAIATEARFELAELLAQRDQHDQAAQLLVDVLDKEPPLELTEKARLRLGTIHAAKGNLKAALGQFDAVLRNPKSSLLGWAQYRAGEALLQAGQAGEAVKRLVPFRDQGPFQNVPGLSDRALLRLGHALAQEKQWDQSRQTLERLVAAFPTSAWVHEARYGIGWAWQQAQNHDAAANAYKQVTDHHAGETAARAQLQMGLCRLEQKRYSDAANALMVVPTTYDFPELTAAALLEAARAYLGLGQRDQAQRLLERIMRDFAGTPWADAAKERLAAPGVN